MNPPENASAYEYSTAVLTHGFMGIHKGEIKRSLLEQALNQKGAEGWDLVHVWFDQKLQQEKDGHLLIFRRLAESGPAVAVSSPEPLEVVFGSPPGGEGHV
jgi:hypothetical protein